MSLVAIFVLLAVDPLRWHPLHLATPWVAITVVSLRITWLECSSWVFPVSVGLILLVKNPWNSHVTQKPKLHHAQQHVFPAVLLRSGVWGDLQAFVLRVCVCSGATDHRGHKRTSDSPGVGVTSICLLPIVGAGNRTLVRWKSCKSSLSPLCWLLFLIECVYVCIIFLSN